MIQAISYECIVAPHSFFVLDVGEHATVIEFKKKDLTSIEDLRHIASGMANLYSYEAGSLWGEDFQHFIANLKYRVRYVIVVGRGINGRSGEGRVERLDHSNRTLAEPDLRNYRIRLPDRSASHSHFQWCFEH